MKKPTIVSLLIVLFLIVLILHVNVGTNHIFMDSPVGNYRLCSFNNESLTVISVMSSGEIVYTAPSTCISRAFRGAVWANKSNDFFIMCADWGTNCYKYDQTLETWREFGFVREPVDEVDGEWAYYLVSYGETNAENLLYDVNNIPQKVLNHYDTMYVRQMNLKA